ncbi:MAG: pyridoxamine 5'-phosphate oxidase [Deltaproteobacteria bacterium]|nr:pyridoxamine 5'-phosphate oxidase [Deltaproteobacteria bacterium]
MLTRPWLWSVRPLCEQDLNPDPFAQFERWFRRARRSLSLEFPEAMCLSTVRPDGFPDGRLVLLKGFDHNGFVFYTNTLSSKGRSLAEQPKAALTMYWEPLQRQVRIRGTVQTVTADEADAYFASRHRSSCIGAWASLQSEPLRERAELEKRVLEFKQRFKGQPVPRPPHWSGYRLKPDEIEFWQLRASRLHDRFVYTKNEQEKWQIQRLYP